MARRASKPAANPWRQPSWWIVVIAGTLLGVFLVAGVREIFSWRQVHRQVNRLRQQVASAQANQQQLQDVIDYLGSPTFQERAARLQLGLKKSGERVIVVPTTNDSVNGSAPGVNGSDDGSLPTSRPARWWSYFFGSHSSS